MKTIGILAIIVGIFILAGIWLTIIWNRIVFTLSFMGVDLSTLNLTSLTGIGQTDAKLLLGITIKNDNGFSIPINNAKVWLYYDNTLIAESSEYLYMQSLVIPSYGSKDITDYVNVHLNSASGKLIKDTVSKQNPKVNYTVKITVFGISLSYSDYFKATV